MKDRPFGHGTPGDRERSETRGGLRHWYLWSSDKQTIKTLYRLSNPKILIYQNFRHKDYLEEFMNVIRFSDTELTRY